LPSLQSSVGPPAFAASTGCRAIALLFAVAASLQQCRSAATTLASMSQRRELKQRHNVVATPFATLP